MSRYLVAMLGFLLALAGPLRGQSPGQPAAVLAARFESWRPGPPSEASVSLGLRLAPAPRHRGRNALLGGAIGAAAGVLLCTAVSTIADDSADGGVSFCPLDSYLLIGGAGFALGFAIGWIA
jgi:hypothetical protein